MLHSNNWFAAGDPAPPIVIDTALEGVGCDGFGVNATDAQAAIDAFKSECDNQSNEIVAHSNSVTAFFCHWQNGSVCSDESFQHAVDMVNSKCGMWQVRSGFCPPPTISVFQLMTGRVQAGSYTDGPDDSKTYSFGLTNWNIKSYCNNPSGKEPV